MSPLTLSPVLGNETVEKGEGTANEYVLVLTGLTVSCLSMVECDLGV